MNLPRLFTLILAAVLATTASFGQTYTNMKNPGSLIALWAGCRGIISGDLVANCFINLSTSAYPEYTGGNAHTANYHSPAAGPASFMSPNGSAPWTQSITNINTGPSGQFYFYIKAGQREMLNFDIRKAVGHPEKVTNCPSGGGPCYTYDYAVGYTNPPLYWVGDKPEYVRVGATREHMNSVDYNHWMQSDPAYGIWWAVGDYILAHPEQGKMALNDMSLPFGGLFDIAGIWQPSHWNHGDGKAVDIRANSATDGLQQYSLPDNPALHSEFMDRAIFRGAYHCQVEEYGKPRQHIHCNW